MLDRQVSEVPSICGYVTSWIGWYLVRELGSLSEGLHGFSRYSNQIPVDVVASYIQQIFTVLSGIQQFEQLSYNYEE